MNSCTRACKSELRDLEPRLVVLTGGPGAGKTALVEIIRRHYCRHIVVLPEAASIVFGGGFPRLPGASPRRAAQRAILSVQRELERIEHDARAAALVVCDRGLLDGLAYWPGDERGFFDALGVSRQDCLARYASVIHLHPPSAEHGYDHSNPVRTETAEEAAIVDARIQDVWRDAPSRVFVPSAPSFLTKARAVLDALDPLVPECCRDHAREALA